MCTANVINEMNHNVTKQKVHHSNLAMVRFLNMGKLHPKLGVIVNKVQLKKSGSVICLEFQILVVLGISNWHIKVDIIYIQ